MVLEYLHKNYPEVPSLEIERISRSIGTTIMGTPGGSNLENINRLLEKSVPSTEFKRDISHPSWESIVKEIKEFNKPVIVWIRFPRQTIGHSVVVYDYQDEKVFYHDPFYGKVEEEIGAFLDKWEPIYRFTIRLKFGERVERKMTEYLGKEEKTDV